MARVGGNADTQGKARGSAYDEQVAMSKELRAITMAQIRARNPSLTEEEAKNSLIERLC